MRYIFLLIFLVGCGGKITPQDLTKNLRSDSKLAYTIKRYQTTACKDSCLVDKKHWVEHCYIHSKNNNAECVNVCPFQFLQFLCVDLQRDENNKQRHYVITPAEWQRDVKHLTGIFFTSQIKNLIAQPEYMCEQDFAVCANHLEVIKSLQRFYYSLSD